MSRKTYLAFLTLIILVLIGNNLWQRLRKSGAPEASKPQLETRATPPVVSTEIQWDDENEIVFRDWEAELEEILEPTAFAKEFEVTVKDGEMMVSEATEVEPGVFHFTTLTPRLKFDPASGKTNIEIQSERLALSLGGDLDRLIAPSIIVPPNTIAAVSSFSDKGRYELTVSAKEVAGGIQMRGSISETGSSLHSLD